MSKENVFHLIEDAAAAHPDKIAFRFQGDELRYADVMSRASGMSQLLKRFGVAQDEPVLFYAQNCPDHACAMIAACHHGAIHAPVNDGFQSQELRHILTNSEATLAFVAAPLIPRFLDAAAATGSRCRIVVVGSGDAQDAPSILGRLDDLIPKGSDAPAARRVASDPCLIVYTSGSTAMPKAVLHSHGSTGYALNTYADIWDYRVGDVAVVSPPMSWVFGLILTSVAMLTKGTTVILLPKFHPERVLEAIEANGAQLCFGTMSMYSKMLDVLSKKDFDLSSLRFCMVGGEPCPASSLAPAERRFGLRFTQAWAFSENHPLVAMRPTDIDAPLGTAGRPAPGVEIVLRGEDGVTPTPDGMPGEAWVRGPGAMTCYYGDPDLTAEKIDDNGWIRTGDLLIRDAAGYISVVGRATDMIIRNGANIAPSEVENAILQFNTVETAAVVGAPDPMSGEAVIAFVSGKDFAPSNVPDLGTHLRASLAAYKVPSKIIVMTDLPVTSNGKIDRKALKAEAEHSMELE